MMNFATLQGLTIPEGVVTQIAKDGVVMWKLETSKPIILEVEKKTVTTYAGETSYSSECVLLDIYPKTNGTVKVTYGGLTKTVTDTSGVANPNAQQVFFGNFNGVSDSMATPANGELTIEGDYTTFGCGSYQSTSKTTSAAALACINNVKEWGDITTIPDNAFYGCPITFTSLPEGVTSIGSYAFCQCVNLALTSLPSGVTSIGSYAFQNCTNLALTSLPSGVTSIRERAFQNCTNLALTSLPSGVTSIRERAFYGCTGITNITIPASVTELGLRSLECHRYEKAAEAFWCNTNIKMLGTTPPTMAEESGLYDDSGAFGRACYYDGIITVPKGCGETYKATDVWNHYTDEITEAS